MNIEEGREREWREEQERMRRIVAERLYAAMPGASKSELAVVRHATQEWKFCMEIAAEIERAKSV